MNSKLKVGGIIGLTALLGACAGVPRSQFSGEEMKSIKSIVVETPPKTSYFAVSAGASPLIVLPGAGTLVAAVSGAVGGTVGALSHKSNPTFDDLVTAKLGETDLNRKLVDQLEASLREQGYDVREVEADTPDMPKTTYKLGQYPNLEGAVYHGADAIMVVSIASGYYAAGVFEPYVRSATVNVAIFRADTLKPVFRDRLAQYAMHDSVYSYSRFADLTADLPHAIQGINEVMMGFVPEFNADILASRGIPSPTAQTKDLGASLQ
jgi:hypothetical protein